MMTDYCFRSRIETAKAQLKKMFSVDVCQQMDVLFADVLHDLETKLLTNSTSSSQSNSSTNCCNLIHCDEHSDDSGIHSTSSENEHSLLAENSEDFSLQHSNDEHNDEKTNSVESTTCTTVARSNISNESEDQSSNKLKTKSEANTSSENESDSDYYVKKNKSKHRQFTALQIDTDDVVCPIAWCDHVSYRR